MRSHLLYVFFLSAVFFLTVDATAQFQRSPLPEKGNVEFTIDQIRNASSESNRLLQIQTKYDRQVTGLYLPEGNTLTVNVQNLSAPNDGKKVQLIVGTQNRTGNKVTTIPLEEGLNEIPAGPSGLVYLEFTSNESSPTGKARVSFVAKNNSFVKAPLYIKGETHKENFIAQLELSENVPDVSFMSDLLIVVVSREAAMKFSVNEDIETWLNNVERILKVEDEISGIDANDPNPLHHPLAKGIRYLFVEVGSGYMYATNGLTGYKGDAALRRLLTNDMIVNNCWGVAHELGHQHQQAAYKPGYFTEVTVNIYAAAANRMFQEGRGNVHHNKLWEKLPVYFEQPDGKRNFYDKESLGTVGSSNDVRFIFIEQLRLLFGEEFFKRLHRVTREERVAGGSDDERIAYLLRKTCQITGYDLRPYFQKWAITLPSYHQEVLDQEIHDSKLPLAPHISELHLVSTTNLPTWAPLPLKGISTSREYKDPQPVNSKKSLKKYVKISGNTITDPRDNKKYTYKQYGSSEWFTQNLDWDGYDGKDNSTKGTVGIYGNGDPDGSLYGRLYPTYAGSATNDWCPPGWRVPTENDWNNLYKSISEEYGVSIDEVSIYLKSGGDRDYEKDGLWKKGAGAIDKKMSPIVGFNILPAGVFNKDTQAYDPGDEPGSKASFPGSGWHHQEFNAGGNQISHPNRNTKHYGSVRCMR